MKKACQDSDDMRPEYDFSKGVRGKYAKRCAEGTNLILLDPSLADVFPDSDSVNEVLRPLARIIRSRAKFLASRNR